MATATTTKEVTKIVLELTKDEAHTLASLLSRVGGDAEKSARKYVNDVKKALGAAGFDAWASPFTKHLQSVPMLGSQHMLSFNNHNTENS